MAAQKIGHDLDPQAWLPTTIRNSQPMAPGVSSAGQIINFADGVGDRRTGCEGSRRQKPSDLTRCYCGTGSDERNARPVISDVKLPGAGWTKTTPKVHAGELAGTHVTVFLPKRAGRSWKRNRQELEKLRAAIEAVLPLLSSREPSMRKNCLFLGLAIEISSPANARQGFFTQIV